MTIQRNAQNAIDLPATKHGFSLVELMVTITIIVLLASVVLFGMSGVMQTAKEQRTRSQISKLHEMVVQAWESIEELQTPGTTPLDRLAELRTLTRMELPDRGTDVITPDWYFRFPNARQQFYAENTTLRAISSGAQYYYDFVKSHQIQGKDWMESYASAECLYMIVSRLDVGGASGLEQLHRNDVADTDMDGLPEIIDGWGIPIRFIRWPAGFLARSPINTTQTYVNTSPIQDGTGFDPFDKFGDDVDTNSPKKRGFFVFPLIFSCGADHEADLAVDEGNFGTFSYSTTNPNTGRKNDPYAQLGSGAMQAPFMIGRPDGNSDGRDNWSDNIHNHSLAAGDK